MFNRTNGRNGSVCIILAVSCLWRVSPCANELKRINVTGCSRRLRFHGSVVTVDYVPLGMSVPLYAIILHVLRSCLVTIRTIRTNVLMKHNWMYGKQSSSKSIVFSPKLGNGFKKQGFSPTYNRFKRNL